MIDANRRTEFQFALPRAVKKPKPKTDRSTSQSRARLSRVLLVYVLAIVGVALLVPLDQTLFPTVDTLNLGEQLAIAASHALFFVPLGFLFPLTREGWEPSPFSVFFIGAVVGCCLAATQPIEGEWLMPITHAAADGIGAGAGAWLLGAANRRIQGSARLVGRLSLEIPLVALIYLLLPLVLGASLTAVDQPMLAVSLLPLGLLGARLISAVQEHHFGPGGAFRTRSIAIVASGWMTLGVFPVVLRSPTVGIGLILLVGLATAHEASIPAVHGGPQERRFEAEALRSAIPYGAAYFATAILVPLSSGMGHWCIALGLTGAPGDLSQQLIQLLQPIAALTVMGYMLAEARGRRERPFRETVWRILAECGGIVVAIEGSRAFQNDGGASVLRLILMLGASVLGAGIYHSQRERIHWILIHQPGVTRAGLKAELRVS